jgi:hypothetical protein
MLRWHAYAIKEMGWRLAPGLLVIQSEPWRGPTDLRKASEKMLFTIAIVLIVLWALGLVSSYTMGGFIHILLVLAIAVFLIRLIQGRRVI